MVQVEFSHKMVIKKVSKYSFFFGFFFIVLLVGVFSHPVFAQYNSNWAPQQRIPGYDNLTWPPILISDQNRMVHAFSHQWLNKSESNDVRAIVYNRWIHGQGWSRPVDILFSPLKNDARLLDARLDEKGIVHIIFWGGDNTGANIYYSHAPIIDAGNAIVWSSPILVAENAQDPENGALYTEDQNTLVILFAGRSQGNGLYSISSLDGGASWSKPMPLYNTHTINLLINNLKIFTGASGWTHAIWNEITPEGQGRGIYYSKKQINDSKWSRPVNLASAEAGYGTNTPAIIEYHDFVLAFYNLGGIIWQRSNDGEQDWTPPIQLFTRHVGVNGSLSLAVDSNDDLHLLFGQRIAGSPDIHGIWHSILLNTNNWSEPEAVVSGPVVVDQTGDKAFDPYEARAVVSQGNVLLVTWRSDPGLKGNGVWYSEKILDATELILVTPDVVSPTRQVYNFPTGTPSNSVTTPYRSPIATSDTNSSLTNSSIDNNSTSSVLIAIVPVFLLISTIIIYSLIVRHKSN